MPNFSQKYFFLHTHSDSFQRYQVMEKMILCISFPKKIFELYDENEIFLDTLCILVLNSEFIRALDKEKYQGDD